MKTRIFLKLMASVAALLVLALPAVGQGQQPNRVDVLIGFVSPPIPEDVAIVQAVGGQVRYVYSIVPAMAASVPEPALRGLAQDRRVRYIEADAPVYTTSQTVPWGIDRVFGAETHSFGTWDTTKGHGIAVAVLDTGIDENHQDLTVAYGTTTVDNTHWGSDGSSHGTHVAGTIAALDNTLGVVGVAPQVGLYAVKVLSDGGSGTVGSVVAGIDWAVEEKIPVLNMSLGTSSHSQTLQDACDAAYAKGHLLVASAGNSGNPGGRGNNVGYPARYSSVIAVAASNANDSRASFSSTGPAVELIAPGVNILSTWPGNNYGAYNGTSMASPHVAGVAALVWAAAPELNNVQVRTILQDTAQNLGLPANHQGYGLVRADLAVKGVADVGSPTTFTITATAGDDGSISPSGAVTVNEGADQSFTITPSAGYQIADVVVDGNPVGAVSSYTFFNVTQNHSISASFKIVEAGSLSIDQFLVSNNSNPAWARATVTWAVSGSNLATVTSELLLDGVVDSQTSHVSGSSASGQHELSARRSQGTYSVRLTVSDGSGSAVWKEEDL